MMISEVLQWKIRNERQEVINAYIPSLKGFIEYFESCIKKKKISESKPYKGLKNEAMYPIKLKNSNKKAIIIESQRIGYLMIYEFTKNSSEVKVYPFEWDYNTKNDEYQMMQCLEHPSLSYLMARLDNLMFKLLDYSESTYSKVVFKESYQGFNTEAHSHFISTLEFTCMSMADNGLPEYEAQDLYDGFKPVFDEYKDFHEQKAKERANIPELTEDQLVNIRAKLQNFLKEPAQKTTKKKKK